MEHQGELFQRNYKKNRNGGFSLIEVLIAVVVLAIVAIPMIHLFLTSTKINVKSRETLRATTVAQDIMEGLKACDVGELEKEFQEPETDFSLIDRKLVKGDLRDLSEDEQWGKGIDGLFYFAMTDVTMQGTEYDTLIKLDARGYMEDGLVTSVPDETESDPMKPTVYTGHDQEHNNTKMAKISSVVEGQDGLYVEKRSDRDRILDEIWNEYRTELEKNGYSREDLKFSVEENMGISIPKMDITQRETVIDIKDTGDVDADGNPIAEATVRVTYYCQYPSGSGEAAEISVPDELPTDNSRFSGENFYVFYYPFYAREEVPDAIEINNIDGIPLQLILVKQADETLSEVERAACDESYMVDVDLKGFDKDKLDEQLVIRTNLGDSVMSETFLRGKTDIREARDRVKFRVKGISGVRPFDELQVYRLTGERLGAAAAAPDVADLTSVIYDVDVAIYKRGAADRNFPMEERVMLLSGSKIN